MKVSDIKKIIFWGDKLYETDKLFKIFDQESMNNTKLHDSRGTFSYVFYGFARAFDSLNYTVYWLDNTDDISDFDFDFSLIFAYNNTIRGLPVNDNSFYWFHNVYAEGHDMLTKIAKNRVIHYNLSINWETGFKNLEHTIVERKDDYEYVAHHNDTYFMFNSWATDLLPHEITKNIETFKKSCNRKNVVFIGTLTESQREFATLASKHHLKFMFYGGVNRDKKNQSVYENMNLIKDSYIAPCIQEEHQIQCKYVPCRAFKNISYGKMPYTNNIHVHNYFGGKVIYDADLENLLQKAIKFENSNDTCVVPELMIYVRDNHTYVSRVNSIFNFINSYLSVQE